MNYEDVEAMRTIVHLLQGQIEVLQGRVTRLEGRLGFSTFAEPPPMSQMERAIPVLDPESLARVWNELLEKGGSPGADILKR